MTDSPTSQAMHLAMTELKEREQRIAVLEEALNYAVTGIGMAYDCVARGFNDEALLHLGHHGARLRDVLSVLNKETNRGNEAPPQRVWWCHEATLGRPRCEWQCPVCEGDEENDRA